MPEPQRSYVPSPFVIVRIVNPITRAIGGPTVTVRGRTSGRDIATPIPPFELDGVRYLVAAGGQTQWARNLRAAGCATFRNRAKTTPFLAVELDGDERDRVVAAYRDRFGKRVAGFFRALPNLADHPVFRMDMQGN
jgi:deazaflavin-dependent oxidoreductase (nitroreductase family)